MSLRVASSPRPSGGRAASRPSRRRSRPTVPARAGLAVGALAATLLSPLASTAAHAATLAPVAASGYWMATTGGQVASFGGVAYDGSATTAASPVVATAATPDGKGYWLADANGGISTFGDAPDYGSAAGLHLNQPIVGMAATPDGGGYWLVAADGGIFTYGDARFYGSTGNLRLNKPIVGMAATTDGGGYWLVAADGGIFTFGDARFHGSAGNLALAEPIVGMAPTTDGGGYWLVAADGGIFTYGDAPFRGSGSLHVPAGQSVVAMAAGPGSGTGVSGLGGFALGPVSAPSDPTTPTQVAAYYAPGATGYDISWPQCSGAYPPAAPVAVVGVNDGTAFSTNPCLASEAGWAGSGLSLYLNMNAPQGSSAAQGATGPAGNCTPGQLSCVSYNYGYNTALASLRAATATGADARTYWLDVETTNYWTSDTAANAQVIAGALAALAGHGRNAAIYATNYQWGVIAGSFRATVPVWYPTGTATAHPASWCSIGTFSSASVKLVQSQVGTFDGDYSC